MESSTTACKPNDILSSPWRTFVLFWLPPIAIIVSGSFGLSSGWRTIVWVLALITMGTACVVNALRCGRLHCYITGPFFFLMAFLTVLYDFGVVSLGRRGWMIVELTILVGAVVLTGLPEVFLGKYRKVAPEK